MARTPTLWDSMAEGLRVVKARAEATAAAAVWGRAPSKAATRPLTAGALVAAMVVRGGVGRLGQTLARRLRVARKSVWKVAG